MARVFDAFDERLERPVAVKILRAETQALAGMRQRFQQEALIAARLIHPHIVAVLDFGEEGASSYLVMERLPGTTLRDEIVARGPLSTRSASLGDGRDAVCPERRAQVRRAAPGHQAQQHPAAAGRAHQDHRLRHRQELRPAERSGPADRRHDDDRSRPRHARLPGARTKVWPVRPPCSQTSTRSARSWWRRLTGQRLGPGPAADRGACATAAATWPGGPWPLTPETVSPRRTRCSSRCEPPRPDQPATRRRRAAGSRDHRDGATRTGPTARRHGRPHARRTRRRPGGRTLERGVAARVVCRLRRARPRRRRRPSVRSRRNQPAQPAASASKHQVAQPRTPALTRADTTPADGRRSVRPSRRSRRRSPTVGCPVTAPWPRPGGDRRTTAGCRPRVVGAAGALARPGAPRRGRHHVGPVSGRRERPAADRRHGDDDHHFHGAAAWTPWAALSGSRAGHRTGAAGRERTGSRPINGTCRTAGTTCDAEAEERSMQMTRRPQDPQQ